MEIGEIKKTPESLLKQSWRRGPLVKGPLRMAIEKLEVGQCFSVSIGESDNRDNIRDRISSARKQVSAKQKKQFSVHSAGEFEFIISRTK